MSIFGRRTAAPPTMPNGSATPVGDLYGTSAAYPGVAPVAPIPAPRADVGLPIGWAPYPGRAITEDQYKGGFAGTMLNQYPAYIPGVQLHQGREFGNSAWYTPHVTYQPGTYGTPTTTPGNISGGQRVGAKYNGPLGPISARRAMAQVVAAQVRQSGLQAMKWAQGLSPQ